jgi:hypothetical protein
MFRDEGCAATGKLDRCYLRRESVEGIRERGTCGSEAHSPSVERRKLGKSFSEEMDISDIYLRRCSGFWRDFVSGHQVEEWLSGSARMESNGKVIACEIR